MSHKYFLLSLFGLFLMITLVSAWPYQLNLSNGVLYDLNASNNATTNFTIYILPLNYTIQNITWINITNVNLTCINCTNYNNYTYTYIFNDTNGSYYNKTDSDVKFLTIIDFNSFKNTLTIPTDYNNAIATLNQSIIDNNNATRDLTLWVLVILSILLSIIGIGLGIRQQM